MLLTSVTLINLILKKGKQNKILKNKKEKNRPADGRDTFLSNYEGVVQYTC